MFKIKQFRAKADEYRNLGNSTSVPGEAREFQKLEQSFTTLADNEQWLADNHDKTVRARDRDRVDGIRLAEELPGGRLIMK
jgi:hypothetical protein